jgi:dTDP-4-amino-4,6-dideoxygalactose transaminase
MIGQYPIKTGKTAFENMPPFGAGHVGYGKTYGIEADSPETDGILKRHVAIPIGPLYTNRHIDRIIDAVEKTAGVIYG